MRFLPALLTTGLAVSFLSACASAEGRVESSVASVTFDESALPSGPVEKNRIQWIMPLDAYMVPDSLEYVLDIMIEPCMQEQGFTYQSPPFDLTARSETMTVSGRNLFNVDVAGKWGYSGAPNPNAEVIAKAERAAGEWSSEQQSAFGNCLEAARKEFPEQSVNAQVTSMAVSAWTDALSAPGVSAAAEQWVECMRPLGFSDLGDSPHDADGGTPTLSMSAAYGEVADGMSNEQTPEQEAEEIRIATFDAECQESSGYAQALYDAEWELQEQIIAENEDVLTRLLDEQEAYELRVREILDEEGLG